MINLFKGLFSKPQQNNTSLRVSHFPKDKDQVYKTIAKIIQNPDSLSDICELNYGSRDVSEEDKKVIQQLEKKYDHKFFDKLSWDLNKHVEKRKLHGYRFSFKNQSWDLFQDESDCFFLGQSTRPNHQVFDHKHQYLGDILSSGPSYELEIVYNIAGDRIFDKLLGVTTQTKYQVNLEDRTITEVLA